MHDKDNKDTNRKPLMDGKPGDSGVGYDRIDGKSDDINPKVVYDFPECLPKASSR